MDSIANFFGLNKKPASSSSSSTKTNSSSKSHHKQMRDSFVLAYDSRYYDIHFRDVRGGMRQATVAELKERCKSMTGVTIATMKLKVSGAFIKDDTATLTSSGIHDGCIVYVMGDRANNEQLRQTASGNPEEVGYMIRISKVMDKIEGSKDKIEEFDIRVVSLLDGDQSDAMRKETEDLGIYLSELLMQSLIALDGVNCPSEFVTARDNRRQGVKQCQALMDRVDQARAALKQNKQKL
ncbi:unnamed protein product [Mucor fragilis]